MPSLMVVDRLRYYVTDLWVTIYKEWDSGFVGTTFTMWDDYQGCIISWIY